ncbi:MAG TPA: hypothetical protein VE890_16945, partial [Thermoguttaceae bacterium]|nr:hypothetical protein [Thermoguttaceae bacterium]
DTDMPGTPGTNKFARALAQQLSDRFSCKVIVRHQLLQDPRVPFTSKNSSASMLLEPRGGSSVESLKDALRDFIGQWFIEGSDPGFCVTETVPSALTEFGERCQRELVTQREARDLAAKHRIHLEGCGGTNDGVIGALAAVGLIAEGNDGRVVQIGAWPDDLSGSQELPTLHARNVEVRCLDSSQAVTAGTVNVGKHLRPNYRKKQIVLYALPAPCDDSESDAWRAVRLT